MLTLRQLYSTAPRLMLVRSTSVKLTKVHKHRDDKGRPTIWSTLRSVRPGLSGPVSVRYTTTITGLGTIKDRRLQRKVYKVSAPRSHVLVSCSCPFFLYYTEVALRKFDASLIIYSNGKPPLIRNPMYYPMGGCKHLARLARFIILKRM